MSRQRIRGLAAGLAAAAVLGALATSASARANHPPSGFAEVGVSDGQFRSLDNVAVASVGGNPLLFLLGCFGHAVGGSLAGYQNDTAGVFFKVPDVGGQAEVVFTQGSIAPPNIPSLVNAGTLTAFAAGQQPTVGTIDFPNGNFLLAIGFDPHAFPGTPFTRNAIAINVKNTAGNALAGSPIISLNGELGQMTTTGAPTLTPPRFPQPLQWDCDKVKLAQNDAKLAGDVAASLGLLTSQQKRLVKRGKAALVDKFLRAEKALEGVVKKDAAGIQADGYKAALDSVSAILGDAKAVELAGKTLAPQFSSPAARTKFQRAEQKALAGARAAAADIKGMATVT
jgi:hypothetical protein